MDLVVVVVGVVIKAKGFLFCLVNVNMLLERNIDFIFRCDEVSVLLKAKVINF